jgi:hypothetical protein
MAEGTHKPINRIKIGDKVRTLDPATGKTVTETVTRTFLTNDINLTNLTVTTAGVTSTLRTTTHHRVYGRTRRAFLNVGDLTIGDQLATANGQTTTVAAVRSWAGLQWMYDLTVENTHTFFVGSSATDLLIHNCGITQTARRIQHILDRHVERGRLANPALKSIFANGENPADLVSAAESVARTAHTGCYFQRIVFADSLIGCEQGTGQGTFTYTVITNAADHLVTVFLRVP